MRKVLLTALLALALPTSAHAARNPLNHRDAAVAAYAYMHRFFPRTPFHTRCHDGPLDPWCTIYMSKTGCGCDYDHPASLRLDVVIEPVRGGGMVVHDGFFRNTRLVLHWRPL